MFQWLKAILAKKQYQKEKKSKQIITDLKVELEKQEVLYKIKTKQYNDFMVEAQLRITKLNELLTEEKINSQKLLNSRTTEIGLLKKEITVLEKKVKDLTENNNLLRTTLGHF